ncbi:MAG: hypothetical protein KJZ74_04730 [Gemmatimonadales bacterium]|nr:hypothetical protein [Gemmatimonadales bacterium]
MSAIAAHCGAQAAPGGAARIARMLDAMHARGTERHVLAPPRDAAPTSVVIGAVRHPWETTDSGADTSAAAALGTRTLVADATLVHRAALRRALDSRGAPAAAGAGDAALLLALLASHGEGGVSLLEGEFAFIQHDAASGRILAARDFAGSRSLYYAHVGGVLLLATLPGALLADPAVPRALDLATLASVAAGLWSHAPGTAYRAIRELPAGHLLTWTPGHEPETRAHWEPEAHVERRRRPLGEAAEELRALLLTAVQERLDPTAPTAVSLSGGWDSTAVFASAMEAGRRAPGNPGAIRAVSISYPEGDPGREDDTIRAVLGHWQATTHWLDVDAITLFDGAAASAARRDGPFAHAFEHWNRALYRGARAVDARVMLDGAGGDQLFQVSDVYLADLFAWGRWIELARQWRGRGGRGLRNFYRWAVRPALPPAVQRGIAAVRRRHPPRDHLHREAPFWFCRSFLDAHGVMEREASARPPLPRASRVLHETHAYLRFPYFSRILSQLHGFAQEEGVALRSPLLDARVVTWALRRPWSERADRAESKVALRAAMDGLLPPQVLAPRTHRTGITSAYFLRQLRGPGRVLVEGLLDDSHLASMGMIDLRLMRRAWDHVLRHDDDETGARLFFTLQAELWLRAQADVAGSAP